MFSHLAVTKISQFLTQVPWLLCCENIEQSISKHFGTWTVFRFCPIPAQGSCCQEDSAPTPLQYFFNTSILTNTGLFQEHKVWTQKKRGWFAWKVGMLAVFMNFWDYLQCLLSLGMSSSLEGKLPGIFIRYYRRNCATSPLQDDNIPTQFSTHVLNKT